MRGNHSDVSRPARSHSQLSQWAKCGEAYRLAREAHVPELPGIYLAAGKAAHSTIEAALRYRIGG